MDYELQRCTRRCATTGRELAPGEDLFSAVIDDGGDLKRCDYSIEAWTGPPEGAIGWWKSQVPGTETKRASMAPNEVVLQFFEQLAGQPERHDMRYVLALLLVRRRVLRMEAEERDEAGRQTLVLYCPRRDETFRVEAVMPDESRIGAIQEEVAQLLFGAAG